MILASSLASVWKQYSNQQLGMRLFTAFLCFGVILFSRASLGQKLDKFMEEHRVHIQNYIMAGYGGGWARCDMLSLNPLGVDTPQFIMGFETFYKHGIGSALSSSHCLLATYHIENKESLYAIIEFGWRVLQFKRVALILSMTKGITLDMATNTANLPFLIAAKLEGGGRQFLCPIIGRAEPLMQGHMCDMSYVSYRYKKLRVGVFGITPHIFPTKDGIDGTDIRLVKLLAEKLKFMPMVVIPRSYEQGSNMVGNNSKDIFNKIINI